jgi:hypothetical protein
VKKSWCAWGLGLVLSACGGGPSGPSGLPAIRVVAGDTGQPVAGAQVLLDGRSYTTIPSGEIELDGNLGTSGHPLRIDSPGFLVRETVAPRASAEAITLWPVRGAYSDAYVRSLLYKPSDSGLSDPAGLPDQPLMRIAQGRVSLVVEGDLRADEAAMATFRRGIETVNAATEGQVVFSVDDNPAAGIVFRLSVDPATRDGAFTYRTLRENAIVGGRIVFSQRNGFAPARDVRYIVHELGHVLGLQHSTVPSDMMYFSAHSGSPLTFSAEERLTIKLLLQRAPGNQYPDRDRNL